MIDSPASAAADSDLQPGYFCAACKRRHEGQPYGSVGTSLNYCEPAIAHLLTTGVIEKQDAQPGRRYSLRRDR